MKGLAIAGIAAAGLVTAVAIATIPAWAGPSPGPGPGVGISAPGPGMGIGMGRGGHGMQLRDGTCIVADAPSGVLTDQQRSALAANAEEEKLAHDLYTEFANRYSATIFDRIATAETAHLDAVRRVMARYGVQDPTVGKASGQFADPAVQRTYNDLLARGSANEQAALEVGRTVETQDIEKLKGALEGLTAPDVQRLYNHLVMASQHHLAAFTNWLVR